jgi:histone deacetylase HOS3
MEVSAPTASSIGADHFQKELRRHESLDLQSKTLVVIQDACYGHRFSRPRTSKAALSTIVERPERLRASILGLSTAYVRAGKRHAGASFAPHPDLELDLLPPPPFQIRKTSRMVPLNSPVVTHVHGNKWMDDLKVMCDAAESRLALNGKELVRPKTAEKDDGANAQKLHEGDLYLCSESLNALQGALGGVCEAVDTVLNASSTRRAFVCIRPPGHHCSSGHPSGFCWLNNVHVGIAHAAMTHGLTHAAILDFDLHHGDGSQAIAWEQNQRAVAAAKNAAPYKKTAIGYYSLHDINSYPCEMGEEEKVRNASVCVDNAHGQSIWNVHLESWKTPDDFWRLYERKYSILLDKARDFLKYHTDRLLNTPGSPVPKAAIFLSAGFDASEWEGAGMQRHKVNVPTDFYARFTADVVRLAEEQGLGTDGRIISVLEGGYSDRALASGVLSHLSGLADSQSSAHKENGEPQSRLASEMRGRLGWDNGFTEQRDLALEQMPTFSFETDWWAPNLLDEIEALAYPPPPPPVKKGREKSGPTFFSPTQSSSAKVVLAPRDRKSSGYSAMDEFIPQPLPEVDWATAAHELWKVLIPSARQTMSCRPEDLNAEASRARREKFTVTDSSPATPGTEAKRMQLRERKPKSSLPGTPPLSTPRRPSSRSSRRTTIGSVSDLPDPTLEAAPSKDASQQRRRQSAVSVASDAGEPARDTGRRTPTRASSRPAPVVSSNPTGVVAGKKPPVSSGSRTGTPKRSVSPRKAPPIPKVPSLYLNNHSATSASETGSQSGTDTLRSENGDRREGDVDSIASGMTKLSIKMKVPSPEENVLRDKKAAEQKVKKPTGRSPKKPVASRILPPKSARSIAPKALEKTSTAAPRKSEHAQSVVPAAGEAKLEPDPSVKIEVPPSIVQYDGTGGFSTPPSVTSNAGVPGIESHYGGYATYPTTSPTPAGYPLGQVPMMQPQITVQSPLAYAAPGRHNLPTFTSTSQIPFASQPMHHLTQVASYQPYPQGSVPQPPQPYTAPAPQTLQLQKQEDDNPDASHWG